MSQPPKNMKRIHIIIPIVTAILGGLCSAPAWSSAQPRILTRIPPTVEALRYEAASARWYADNMMGPTTEWLRGYYHGQADALDSVADRLDTAISTDAPHILP